MRAFLLGSLLAVAAALCLPRLETRGSTAPVPVGSPDSKMALSYEKDIEPIMLKRCRQCHGEGDERKGDFNVTRYETLMKGGQGGKAVKPGKSGESLMVRMMLGQQKPFMPPGIEEPVPINDILLIRTWIDQGARGPGQQR